jgi:hypothetical protein
VTSVPSLKCVSCRRPLPSGRTVQKSDWRLSSPSNERNRISPPGENTGWSPPPSFQEATWRWCEPFAATAKIAWPSGGLTRAEFRRL